MPEAITQHIDTDSYRGGQVLIQARAWVGGRIRTVNHRAKIAKLRILDESTLEIECEWVAIKKDGRFHIDHTEKPIMTVEINYLGRDQFHSMIIDYEEDDISLTYTFLEPRHDGCISEDRVIGLKT